jgi:hypothetical protein
MPLLEQRVTIIVRRVREVLNLQAGITRDGVALWPPQTDQNRQLEAGQPDRGYNASYTLEIQLERLRPTGFSQAG